MEVASLSLFTEGISTAYFKCHYCNSRVEKRKKNTGFTNDKVIYSARNA